MSSKVIAVFGATGIQGSSVVSSFLSEPGWKVRGITRNPKSDAAQKLAARGVEVVQADINDPSTLSPALKGASAVFAVTDFWTPIRDPANKSKLKPGQSINEWGYHNELQQAKNIMDAVAKVDSLERFIWSGLPPVSKASKGKYTWVFHCDSKADATEYLKETYPDLWKKSSVIQVGSYLSNHLNIPGFGPEKAPDGVYQMALPFAKQAKWPYIAAEEDTGLFVRALIVDVPAGKNLVAYRERLTIEEFLDIWAKVHNVQSRVVDIPFEAMASAGDDAREIAEMIGFLAEFGFEGLGDPTLIYPKDVSVLSRCFVHC
jgi:NmrA-like family